MAATSVTFETTLSSFGNNTGIEVPPELIEQLGAGRRPPVEVDLDGYRYRSTVGVMGGKHLVSVSAAVRKETGLAGGDPIHVTLTVAEGPRPVDGPTTSKRHSTPTHRRRSSSPGCRTACSATTSIR